MALSVEDYEPSMRAASAAIWSDRWR